MKNENKPEQDKLKAFLGKQPGETADEFEQEALEGFAMLENEQEILELKSQTDAKVNAALQVKRSKKTTYWFAAAGLLLCIGLTVFFVSQQGTLEDNRVAIEEKALSAEQLSPADHTNTDGALATSDSLAPTQYKSVNPVVSSRMDQTAAAPVPSETSQERFSESAGKASPSTQAGAEPEKTAEALANLPLAKDEGAAPTNDAKAVSLEDISNEDREEHVAVVSAQPESKTKKALRKKAESEPATAPASASYESALAICWYEGGDQRLQQDLKKELLKRQLDRPFKANLSVATNGTVERVEFLNGKEFNRDEKKELEAVLKKLSAFKNSSGAAQSYIVDYRP